MFITVKETFREVTPGNVTCNYSQHEVPPMGMGMGEVSDLKNENN